MIRHLGKWLTIGTLLLMTACSSVSNSDNMESFQPLEAAWEEVTKEADGQTVQLYMWGGSEAINRYIDEWVAPRLKEANGVTLNRVPVTDTADILNKLLAEKQAGRTEGTVDIMWINGENFRTAKQNELLLGSFAPRLPNVQNHVDVDAPDIAYDFGLATDGMEAPWGKAQYVFIYDSAHVSQPPGSMAALRDWVKANPGKFTYPAPPDFNGSAFVRHVLYEQTGGHEAYFAKNMDRKAFLERLSPVWTYLNEIEPFLWREGATYPESLAKLDQLFASGEVWMTMGYDPARASNLIKNGTFPATARTFVLDGGTLTNTHYLAIPYNAPAPAAAMAAINFLLSPGAQITKYDPQFWGEDMAIDLSTLTVEERSRLAQIDRGIATLPADVLAKKQLPEIRSEFVVELERGWQDEVAKK
jgi:putative spermidine/putrescine transport system substrate-binding protein